MSAILIYSGRGVTGVPDAPISPNMVALFFCDRFLYDTQYMALAGLIRAHDSRDAGIEFNRYIGQGASRNISQDGGRVRLLQIP